MVPVLWKGRVMLEGMDKRCRRPEEAHTSA